MSHLLISAAHKSSGKTTVSIGLTAALARRGLRVQPFKKGPDYIDPLWLSAAAGRHCLNLDFYTTPREEIRASFAQRMANVDFGLIEGNKGLYDGLDIDGSNSNAALAILLGAPVVLVLDTTGMTRGVAPLLLGYQGFEPDLNIAGVILNKVGGSRHEAKLRRVIEHYTDLRLLGAVRKSAEMNIDERHLGLIPSNEVATSRAQIDLLADRVAAQVDLDALIAVAGQAEKPVAPTAVIPAEPTGPAVKIGLPRDAAFGFYYQDDLERLEQAGAELVFFDTLRDQQLPPVDGLFLGGGFPETAMDELAANQGMLAALREFIAAGGPAYAECGGLMYLTRQLSWQGKTRKMVGILPADTVMHDKPQGRGYVRLRELAPHPWPGEGGPDHEVAAHEFHYSGLENLGAEVQFAYRVARGHGIDGNHDGLVYKNLLASYTHLRSTGGADWPRRFVQFVRRCRGKG